MHTGIRLQKHFTDNEKTVEDSKRQTAVTNRQIFGLQIFWVHTWRKFTYFILFFLCAMLFVSFLTVIQFLQLFLFTSTVLPLRKTCQSVHNCTTTLEH